MTLKKTTKAVVGSSIMLGIGGAALGAIGQGGVATKTIGVAGNMMGAVIPAAYSMDIIQMANKYNRTGRPYKVKKGKLYGIGGRDRW